MAISLIKAAEIIEYASCPLKHYYGFYKPDLQSMRPKTYRNQLIVKLLHEAAQLKAKKRYTTTSDFIDDYSVNIFGWLTQQGWIPEDYTRMIAAGRLTLIANLRIIEKEKITRGAVTKKKILMPHYITITAPVDFSVGKFNWVISYTKRRSVFELERHILHAVYRVLDLPKLRVLHVPTRSVSKFVASAKQRKAAKIWVTNISRSIKDKRYYPVKGACLHCMYRGICDPKTIIK